MGTSDLCCSARVRSLRIRVLLLGSGAMVVIKAPRRSRISSPPFLVHLAGSGLVDGVEEGEELSGRCSSGVVDLVVSPYYVGGPRRRLPMECTCRFVSW